MKYSIYSLLLLSGVLTSVVTSCQHDAAQQAKPTPRVESVTSPTIQVQHDTAAFNKIMKAPTAPDSLSTHPQIK